MPRTEADNWRDTTVLVELTEILVDDTAVDGRGIQSLFDGCKFDTVFDRVKEAGDDFTAFAAELQVDVIFAGYVASNPAFVDSVVSVVSLKDDDSTLKVSPLRFEVGLDNFGDKELCDGFSFKIFVEEGADNFNAGLDIDLLRSGSCNLDEAIDIGFAETPDVDSRFAEFFFDCSEDLFDDLRLTETLDVSKVSVTAIMFLDVADIRDCRFKLAFNVTCEGVSIVDSTVSSTLVGLRSS